MPIYSSKTKTAVWRRHVQDSLDGLGNGSMVVFTNGTKVASTSGTTIDFTIPSGVKEISLMLAGVSHDGTSNLFARIGSGGTPLSSGYIGGAQIASSSSSNAVVESDGVRIGHSTATGSIISGICIFKLVDAATNTWAWNSNMVDSGDTNASAAGGFIVLSGELDTVRLTSASGDTFDAGSVNVQYETPELDPGSDVVSGGVVQTVHTQDGEVATGTTTIPNNDTIPQNTEGNEFMTASITPTDVANKLKIEVDLYGSFSGSGVDALKIALFQDSTADALAVAWSSKNTTTNDKSAVHLTFWMDAGTTSSTTFKVRAGVHSSGTITFNGTSGSRLYGGKLVSNITITEYAA